MRSIIVLADRTSAMDNRLESALDLARSNGGHLTILVDTPVTRFVAMDPLGGSYVAADAIEQALTADDKFAEEIDARLASQDVAFDVLRSEAETLAAIADAARLADVVVVSRSSGMAGEIALNARVPVLVLEDDRRTSFPVERACIAWDGGDEAATALRSAVPLIGAASDVRLVVVKEKERGRSVDEAMRYLSRHGINAQLDLVDSVGSTEETIAAAVLRADAQLLVMGAFGHSRMRQYLFGGVTRYFLEEATGPALLIAH